MLGKWFRRGAEMQIGLGCRSPREPIDSGFP